MDLILESWGIFITFSSGKPPNSRSSPSRSGTLSTPVLNIQAMCERVFVVVVFFFGGGLGWSRCFIILKGPIYNINLKTSGCYQLRNQLVPNECCQTTLTMQDDVRFIKEFNVLKQDTMASLWHSFNYRWINKSMWNIHEEFICSLHFAMLMKENFFLLV